MMLADPGARHLVGTATLEHSALVPRLSHRSDSLHERHRQELCIATASSVSSSSSISRFFRAAVALGSVAAIALGPRRRQSGYSRLGRDVFVQREAVSLLQRMMGEVKSEAELVDEEIADIRHQGEQELEQLLFELDRRQPSEEDIRVQELRRKQEQLARMMGLRRTRRGAVGKMGGSSASQRQPPSPPAPWRSLLDVGSGRWYYHNLETQTTAWELPATVRPPRPVQPPSPWDLAFHASSCSWYFYNAITGETAWELPEMPILVAGAAKRHVMVG
eukprot:TRINITY_DN13163_c0_g2_i1.p1 TRINITY_DN13163_c0_g2~~TRINITY_DN13163_c0_g2_i1.p1  ORF type:complete len:276 (+),score=57.71 TRINITY_DN13163_c0_g2_i1:26-853(+)